MLRLVNQLQCNYKVLILGLFLIIVTMQVFRMEQLQTTTPYISVAMEPLGIRLIASARSFKKSAQSTRTLLPANQLPHVRVRSHK